MNQLMQNLGSFVPKFPSMNPLQTSETEEGDIVRWVNSECRLDSLDALFWLIRVTRLDVSRGQLVKSDEKELPPCTLPVQNSWRCVDCSDDSFSAGENHRAPCLRNDQRIQHGITCC